MKPFLTWLAGFKPPLVQATWRERLTALSGALLGMLAAGLGSRLVLGPDAAVLLIGPMGASAFLLFAVPASPLAQPWSIIGGNCVSAVVGVTVALLVANPFLGAALAVSGSIGAMYLLRCLHPPGGAVALTAVLNAAAIQTQGYSFVLAPVLLNSSLLLVVALLFNNAVRRGYPHVAPLPPVARHQTSDAPPSQRVGFTPADLDAVLERYGETLDIGRDDLDALFRQAEQQAYRRRFGEIRCADIMSRDLLTIGRDTPLREAWTLLRHHRIKGLPVIENQQLVGLLTQSDILTLVPEGASDGDRPSETLMTADPATAREDQPIVELVPLMADGGLHLVPVLDGAGHLTGIVTQSDLIAALYRGSLLGTAA